MATHWGYDCALSTMSTLPGIALDEFIRQNRGAAAFVGRYVCQIPGISDGLTAEEVAYLHGRGRSILPVFNRTSAEAVAGTYRDGWGAGQEAINLLYGLHCPPGVAVYADIEAGWLPTEGWMRGYMENLHRAQYTGGFYLNSQDRNHTGAYVAARAASAAPSLVWSSEPEPWGLHDTVTTLFEPYTGLLGPHAEECVLWQYSENSWPEYSGGLADFDTCTDAGLAAMWHPAPPPPPAGSRWKALRSFGLLSHPQHGSQLLVTVPPNGTGLYEAGRVTDSAGTVWRAGQYVASHGWFPEQYATPMKG